MKHFGRIHFIDRHGLTDRTLTDCPATQSAPRMSYGLKLPYDPFFTKVSKPCNLHPDIIFDLTFLDDNPVTSNPSPADLQRQVEDAGYAVVFVQRGKVPGDKKWARAPVQGAAFIAVSKEVYKSLDQKEIVRIEFGL